MVLWVLIGVGVLLGWLGVKKGLYAMFATLFCLMFSVYIGVLATPKIVRISHGLEQSPYYAAGCVFGMTLLVFLFLWLTAYYYFLRDDLDYFPPLIDRLGGGICGFLFGYILTGMLFLLVCIMPFSRNKGLPEFCRYDTLSRYSVPAVVKTCNFIADYSLECFYGDSEKCIEILLSLSDEPSRTDAGVVPSVQQGGR